MDFWNSFAIERFYAFCSVVETSHADVNICTGKNPRAITLGKKYVAGFFDAFQNFAVCATPNSLRSQQTGAVAPLGGGLMMFPAASTRAAVFRFVTFS